MQLFKNTNINFLFGSGKRISDLGNLTNVIAGETMTAVKKPTRIVGYPRINVTALNELK